MKHNLHQYNEIIKEMIEADRPYKEIAYKLKVNVNTLGKHLDKWFTISKIATYSIKEIKSQILHDNRDDVLEMYRGGVCFREISEKYNVTGCAVYYFIQKNRDKL